MQGFIESKAYGFPRWQMVNQKSAFFLDIEPLLPLSLKVVPSVVRAFLNILWFEPSRPTFSAKKETAIKSWWQAQYTKEDIRRLVQSERRQYRSNHDRSDGQHRSIRPRRAGYGFWRWRRWKPRSIRHERLQIQYAKNRQDKIVYGHCIRVRCGRLWIDGLEWFRWVTNNCFNR